MESVIYFCSIVRDWTKKVDKESMDSKQHTPVYHENIILVIYWSILLAVHKWESPSYLVSAMFGREALAGELRECVTSFESTSAKVPSYGYAWKTFSLLQIKKRALLPSLCVIWRNLLSWSVYVWRHLVQSRLFISVMHVCMSQTRPSINM